MFYFSVLKETILFYSTVETTECLSFLLKAARQYSFTDPDFTSNRLMKVVSPIILFYYHDSKILCSRICNTFLVFIIRQFYCE